MSEMFFITGNVKPLCHTICTKLCHPPGWADPWTLTSYFTSHTGEKLVCFSFHPGKFLSGEEYIRNPSVSGKDFHCIQIEWSQGSDCRSPGCRRDGLTVQGERAPLLPEKSGVSPQPAHSSQTVPLNSFFSAGSSYRSMHLMDTTFILESRHQISSFLTWMRVGNEAAKLVWACWTHTCRLKALITVSGSGQSVHFLSVTHTHWVRGTA